MSPTQKIPCICIVGILHLDCDFLSNQFELEKSCLTFFLSISMKLSRTNNSYFSLVDVYTLGICGQPLVEVVLNVLKIYGLRHTRVDIYKRFMEL